MGSRKVMSRESKFRSRPPCSFNFSNNKTIYKIPRLLQVNAMRVKIHLSQNSLLSLLQPCSNSSFTTTFYFLRLFCSRRHFLEKFEKNRKDVLQFLFSYFDFSPESHFSSKLSVHWTISFNSRFDSEIDSSFDSRLPNFWNLKFDSHFNYTLGHLYTLLFAVSLDIWKPTKTLSPFQSNPYTWPCVR